jgi:hypothetical protein
VQASFVSQPVDAAAPHARPLRLRGAAAANTPACWSLYRVCCVRFQSGGGACRPSRWPASCRALQRQARASTGLAAGAHSLQFNPQVARVLPCRLTPRSSGRATAWHLARETLWFIIRLAGQAPCRRPPLSSNVRAHRTREIRRATDRRSRSLGLGQILDARAQCGPFSE